MRENLEWQFAQVEEGKSKSRSCFFFFRASAIKVKEMHELNISISFFPLCSCRGGSASSKIENKDMERKMHFTPPLLLHTLGGIE